MLKFPSIADVSRELRLINANVEGCEEGCDIRLQVYEDGQWCVRVGDSQYDCDHRGFWGASSIPGVGGRHMRPRRFDSRDIARSLIEQCKEHASDCGVV